VEGDNFGGIKAGRFVMMKANWKAIDMAGN
jgi:hypothetical protein